MFLASHLYHEAFNLLQVKSMKLKDWSKGWEHRDITIANRLQNTAWREERCLCEDAGMAPLFVIRSVMAVSKVSTLDHGPGLHDAMMQCCDQILVSSVYHENMFLTFLCVCLQRISVVQT